MKTAMVVLLAVVTFAGISSAKKHEHKDADFVSGTLQGMKQVTLGTSCDGNSGDCDPVLRYRYTVVSDGVEYILAPIHHGGIFSKESVLAGQRPGTVIKMLMDKTTVYIKVSGDDRESHYRIVGSSTAK